MFHVYTTENTEVARCCQYKNFQLSDLLTNKSAFNINEHF